jgi:hypothetical protein
MADVDTKPAVGAYLFQEFKTPIFFDDGIDRAGFDTGEAEIAGLSFYDKAIAIIAGSDLQPGQAGVKFAFVLGAACQVAEFAADTFFCMEKKCFQK